MIALDLVAAPERLPWLLVAPLVWLLLRALDRARTRRVAALVGPRVSIVSAERSQVRRATHRGLLALGLLAGLAACVHPTWGGDTPELEPRGADVVVCLDVSRSMLARDVAPTRLGRAQAELRALAARARGDRLALVAFAGEAQLLVPLTPDLRSLATLADLADPSSVRRGGTDLGAALEAALAALEGRPADTASVIVLTDGEDLGGRGATAAEACARRGIVVHGVALGTALGGKIPLETEGGTVFLRDRAGGDVVSAVDATGLRRLAERTGGAFVDATTTPGALVSLYEDHILPRAREATASEGRRKRENRFQGPLLLAIGLLLADLALADRRRR